MTELWVALNDIPAEGRVFSFTDQAVWQDRWKEFAIALRPGDEDLHASATVMMQGENAVLVRGELHGSVKLACDRCARQFEFAVNTTFDAYEELGGEQEDQEADVPRLRKRKDGTLEFDMGALLWEELVLTLPVKPLCNEACKGLCPGCGRDLNTEECTCDQDDSDPRLAVFRDLKIK
jgi:uncharacterized protein